jgi:hypothetical protein
MDMSLQTALWKENFDSNFAWQDKFTHQIQLILTRCFNLDLTKDTIEIADYHHDKNLGIDIIVTKDNTIKNIGLRIRNMDQYQYNDEFTVRFPSEYLKIYKGYLGYELYCFGDDNGNIMKFTLIDLKVFLDTIKNKKDAITIPNNDPTKFKAFKYSDFPSNMILATKTRQKEIDTLLTNMKVKSTANIRAALLKARNVIA